MFNKMSNFFRLGREGAAQVGMPQLVPASVGASRPAPATGAAMHAAPDPIPQPEKFRIDYDPGLIDRLEDEHKVMLGIYGRIDAAIALERWEDVPGLLMQFRSKLTDHLLKEGVKLYAYLHKSLQHEDDVALVFQSFKKEMGEIGKVVFNFFDRYVADRALATADQRAAFLAQFKSIGNVLVSRIQREEEQLYAIYRNLH